MFITFEGGDKAGKTTQINMLKQRLEAAGHCVLLTREPGGTPISESIRGILLDAENSAMHPLTEALLYAAARSQHVREVIRPALMRGDVVLCDRFFDSSIAYQAFGRELGVDTVRGINREAMGGIVPDRTYLLSLAYESAGMRYSQAADRIEKEGESFYRRVREGYLYVRTSAPGRVMDIDASAPAGEIADIIWKDLCGMLV